MCLKLSEPKALRMIELREKGYRNKTRKVIGELKKISLAGCGFVWNESLAKNVTADREFSIAGCYKWLVRYLLHTHPQPLKKVS